MKEPTTLQALKTEQQLLQGQTLQLKRMLQEHGNRIARVSKAIIELEQPRREVSR